MRRMFAFLAVSVDGYHEGPGRELDWHNAPGLVDSGFPIASGFHDLDDEQHDEADTFLFGRITYELMAAYWPTPQAKRDYPQVASRMNGLAKIVASTTLDHVDWAGTRLVSHDVVGQLTALKEQPGKDIAILGSSTLTASLLQAGLVDELRLLVNPVALGAGHSVLEYVNQRVPLTLAKTRTFPAGNVLLCYEPAVR
jgi:dihydrofolate reductase